MSEPWRPGSQLSPDRPEHIILIDIDAFDISYLDWVETPHLDDLIRRGAYAVATSVFKSFSNPARSTILTGAWPDVHHNQAYYYDPKRDLAIGQERPYERAGSHTPLRAETIAQALRDEGRTVVGVQYNNLRGHGIEPGDSEYLYATPEGDCTSRVDAAIDVLHCRPVDSLGTPVTVQRVPGLLAVYLNDLDNLGHAGGPRSPDMPALLARVDREVGRLVQATQDLGIFDATTFVVVSDHGMVHIAEPLLPDLLTRIDATGLTWDVAPAGQSPSHTADVVVVPTSRNADLTLRGVAASPEGHELVRDAVRGLGDRAILHDTHDLVRMRAYDRVGDLVAEAVSPYHFGADTDRPPGGGHGGSAEMYAPLVLSGVGIKPGATLVDPALADVAPTVSALLGIRGTKHAQGRVLDEVFSRGA